MVFMTTVCLHQSLLFHSFKCPKPFLLLTCGYSAAGLALITADNTHSTGEMCCISAAYVCY